MHLIHSDVREQKKKNSTKLQIVPSKSPGTIWVSLEVRECGFFDVVEVNNAVLGRVQS